MGQSKGPQQRVQGIAVSHVQWMQSPSTFGLAHGSALAEMVPAFHSWALQYGQVCGPGQMQAIAQL